jgi:hypothetical protein
MHDVMDRHGRPSLGKLARLQYDVGLMYEATKNVDIAGTHYLVARNVSDVSLPPFFMSPFLLSFHCVSFSFAVLYCITCLHCCCTTSLSQAASCLFF